MRNLKSTSFCDWLSDVLMFVFIFVTVAQGYPYGAPENSCNDPAPIHQRRLNTSHVGIFFPQPMSTNIYVLETSSSRYLNGMMIRVTLRAAENDHFKGFFIQATRANYSLDEPDRPAYGTFRPVDQNSQTRSCRAAVGQVGGITHTNNARKSEVSVDWLPPNGCNLGTIQFVATVVREYTEYWVDIRSDPVEPSGFGGRSLLCELYVDPYNPMLQNRVLAALRELEQRRRMNRRVVTGRQRPQRPQQQGRFQRQG